MIVVPKGVCKNILSGRREGSTVNIFVVLLGNAQLSFLMGTTACQGEKLPLPPRLLRRDTGSHPKVKEATTVTPVSGESWADRASALQRGLQVQVLPVSAGNRYFSSGNVPLYSQRQFRPRDDFRIGQLLICGVDLPAASRAECLFLGQGTQCGRSLRSRQPPTPPCHADAGRRRGEGRTEGPCVAGRASGARLAASQHPSPREAARRCRQA